MEWMLLPLKRYADFNGRSRRMEYWMFTLLQVIFLIVAAALGGLLGAFDQGGGTFGSVVLGIFVLAWLGLFFIPTIAVSVRRFHDQDKSGWFYLLSFIPYAGGIIVFVFMCLKGTEGPNQYGDDPLNTERLGDIFK